MHETMTKLHTPVCTLRLRKGSRECLAFVDAVNQGIDGYLEAVTDSKFEDCGSTLQADLGEKDIPVIVRRLKASRSRPSVRLAKTIMARQQAQTQLDEFVTAYLVAALWSEFDDEEDPLEDNYGIEDMPPCTINRAVRHCSRFRKENADDLKASGLEDSRAGHNFWLSRNGHGSGFFDEYCNRNFDRDSAEDQACQALQEAARGFGEANLYVGDDDNLYLT
jgi:hypothetical protein